MTLLLDIASDFVLVAFALDIHALNAPAHAFDAPAYVPDALDVLALALVAIARHHVVCQ